MRGGIWLLLAALAAGAGPLPAAPARSYAGILEAIQGRAFWKASSGARAIPLDPKRDRERKVYAGEYVRCDLGGSLSVWLAGMPKPKLIPGSSAWYRIPGPSPTPPALSAEARRRARLEREAFEEYALGGSERAAASLIFSPAPDSSVRPETLVIRWTPRPGMGAVSLAILEEGGKELWRRAGVDGAAGRLVSEEARQALLQSRAAGGQPSLLLTLTDLEGSVSTVRFSVLSPEEEKALDSELEMWDQKPSGSLIRYLGRIHTFRRHRLFNEAADEYDAALATAPESRDLLIAAIQAHRAIGNTLRERELLRRVGSHRSP